MDYLESERFPDSKSLTCELADFGILSPDKVEKLISQLWVELEKDQSKRIKRAHNAKYLKTSDSGASKVTFVDTQEIRLKNIEYWIKDYFKKTSIT